MKKYFLLMTGFILLAFMACQNDELVSGGGEEVAVSFDVQIPDGGTATRAETEKGNGDGTTVNRCILEIYQGDQLYGKRYVSAITGKKVTFADIRLVTSQTYQFVFWADNVDDVASAINVDKHYVTTNSDGLKNITFASGYVGNDETRDAFFYTMEKTVTAAFTEPVSLTRPFGQLNVKTTDLGDIPAGQSNLLPAKALLTFKTDLYTTFNALSGEASGAQKWPSSGQTLPAAVIDNQGTLILDYILAPSSGQLPVDMTLTTYADDGETVITSKELTSIPIQRNYKTNVSGKLLTVAGKVNVEVKPAFNDNDIPVTVTEVASVEDVTAALAECDNVVVTQAPTQAATIELPKSAVADKELSITLPETNQKITIKYDTSSSESNVPKVLNINIPQAAAEIVIEATETTVYLNGTTYSKIIAGTAPNTLVVGAGVTVSDLTVNAGNVKVIGNGKIVSITKGNDYTGTAYIIASDDAQLPATLTGFERISSEEAIAIKEALAKGTSYQLKEDADITNASIVVPADKVAELDLNGYMITAANSNPIGLAPGIGNITVLGKLTLKDSKGGSGKIVSSKDYNAATDGNGLICVNGENALLTMQGGTLYAVRNNVVANGQYGITLVGGGDFTMTGGRIEAGWYAVSGNGTDKTNSSKINISGGELVSTSDYVLYLPHSGETTLSGGTLTGAAGGVCIQRGLLNISGDASICSLGTGNTGSWSDGTGGKVNTALMVSAGYGDCKVNISGGTMTALKDVVFLKEKSDHKQEITVTGGTFSDANILGYLGKDANVKVEMMADKTCSGFITDSGQTVEIDLNRHTLTFGDPTVGSSGTETNSCQLKKGSKVTFKNGKLTSDNKNIMIQNYCDLLLDNVTVVGEKSKYVVSNNNQSCTIHNSTIMGGKCAFDVYSMKSYPDGVTVTVSGNSIITGKVEFGGDSATPQGKLIINSGTFNGNLAVTPGYYDSENKNIIINGGEFGDYTGWGDYR